MAKLSASDPLPVLAMMAKCVLVNPRTSNATGTALTIQNTGEEQLVTLPFTNPGWDPAEIYRDGGVVLDREEWADLGWLANHMGPSPAAVEVMRALGYAKVYDMGPLTTWAAAGGKIARREATAQLDAAQLRQIYSSVGDLQ